MGGADLRARYPDPVIMISGQATVEMAVRATKLGALVFSRSRSPPTSSCSPVENAVKRCAWKTRIAVSNSASDIRS